MYGLLKKGNIIKIEFHQDLTTLSESIGFHRKTVGGWMTSHPGGYEGDRFIITEHVEVFLSRRGLDKGTNPRSNWKGG